MGSDEWRGRFGEWLRGLGCERTGIGTFWALGVGRHSGVLVGGLTEMISVRVLDDCELTKSREMRNRAIGGLFEKLNSAWKGSVVS